MKLNIFKTLALGVLTMGFVACDEDFTKADYDAPIAAAGVLPEVTTGDADAFGESALISASISPVEGATATNWGLLVSTNPEPSLAGSIKIEGDIAVPSTTFSVTGLTDKTHYYYRTFVSDGVSVAFGETKEFTTNGEAWASEQGYWSFATAAEAEEITEKFKDSYTHGDSDVEFSTSEEICIKKEEAPISILCDVDTAVSKLTGEAGQQDSKYVVKKGETYWSIAEDHGMSVDDLMAINRTGDDSIAYGDVIYIKAAEPLVAVTTTEQVVYTKTLGYKTTVVESSSMYEGTSKITTKGANGMNMLISSLKTFFEIDYRLVTS